LDLDGRILTDGNLDGFLPGEGAGIVLLARPGDRRVNSPPAALLLGAANGFEKGHRNSPEPMLGDGLTQTLQALFGALPGGQLPCRAVMANLNGESFGAKQWGIALLRNRDCFIESPELFHPAECFGEVGAAMGPISIAIVTCWLERKVRDSPFLVWCAADEGPCAACYIAPCAEPERGRHGNR
jgi:3-oxoacyl-[acyl-carrier-protein] synthase I